MDTADIPNGKYCVLSAGAPQTVAGLTVEGQLDVGSKLSVTTMNTTGIFNVPTGGEVDVLGSADLGGPGTISGQIDSQGSSVTFDPSSRMVLGNGAQLTGALFNIFGPLTCNAALSMSALVILDYNGGSHLGSLTGPGSMSDGGEFDWDGGILGLAGGADFIASADLKIQGGGYKELSAGTLTDGCNGSEIGGTNTLQIDAGATFDNEGNPGTDVTIPLIVMLARTGPSGTFLNGGDGFLDVKGTTTIAGHFINLGTLEVGTGSSLTLNQSGGVPVEVDLDGTVQLDGDLTLIGDISSPSGFNEEAGGGTLKVGDGTNAGSLTLASGTSTVLSGNVEVSGTGTLTGAGFLHNSGLLTLDPNSLTTIGSYQQSSIGTLDEQVTPRLSPTFTVTGTAQLSGTLKIDFEDGYTPPSGTVFTVLTAGDVEDHFDTTPDNMTMTYTSTGVTATEN
ncbi:MAG TPA: hypothetical protein VH682_10150 [Gemmataceae bacterium]|jgi:hypothetical protein